MGRYKVRTFAEECAVRYVEAMGRYERQIKGYADALAALDARLEGVGAVAYDRDGGRAEYTDARPALLDERERILDAAINEIRLHAQERIEAAYIFASDTNANICWLKHGLRLTWREVAQETHYGLTTCKGKESAGLEYIFARMPREYRQRTIEG